MLEITEWPTLAGGGDGFRGVRRDVGIIGRRDADVGPSENKMR